MWRLLKAELDYHSEYILYTVILIMIMLIATLICSIGVSDQNQYKMIILETCLILNIIPSIFFFYSVYVAHTDDHRLSLYTMLPVKQFKVALYRLCIIFIVTLPSLISLVVATIFLYLQDIQINPDSVFSLSLMILGTLCFSFTLPKPGTFNQTAFELFSMIPIVLLVVFFFKSKPHDIPLDQFSGIKFLFGSLIYFLLGIASILFSQRLFFSRSHSKRDKEDFDKAYKTPTYFIKTEPFVANKKSDIALKGLVKYCRYYLIGNILFVILTVVLTIWMKMGDNEIYLISRNELYNFHWPTVAFFATALIALRQKKIPSFLISSGLSPKEIFSVHNKLMMLFILPHIPALIIIVSSLAVLGFEIDLLFRINYLLVMLIIMMSEFMVINDIKYRKRMDNDYNYLIASFLLILLFFPIELFGRIAPTNINFVVLIVLMVGSAKLNSSNKKAFLSRESFV
jgi:hypothetical protein